MLSELFETSIDELVKGDVATMEKTIKETPTNIFITTYITTKPEIALTDSFRPLESAG